MRGWVVLVAVAGCHGCREDHPYVPYTISSAEAAGRVAVADAGAGGSGVDARAGGLESEPAVLAPAGVSRWELEGLTLDAPPGNVFVSALARDFDGDGKKDAFAIVRPMDVNDPGVLLLYRGGAPGAPATFAPPGALARDASCVPVDRLEGVGKRAVFVEIGVRCPQHAPGAPGRWIAVVSGDTAARAIVAATIADPEGAPALSVDAQVADRDGDGRDDLALRVTLEGGGPPLEPGPKVTATIAWLDRPAGLSRDASTTEASFAALAATAGGKASKGSEAPGVPGYVAQARALWRAVCSDGGAPRLASTAGTGPIACGAARALEDLGLAEVRAYATMGDGWRAALAFDRAERPPAASTPARVREAQGWIEKVAPVSKAKAVRALAAVPIAAGGREPTWGPLAFEASGKLVVRTKAGVVRVDPDLGDEAAAPDVGEWKAAVTSADGGVRWIETYDPCDGLPLRAAFEPASGDDLKEVALPVAAPIGGKCAGSRGAAARAVPVAWGAGGLEAIVEGEPVLIAGDLSRASALAAFLDQPVVMGAPRSPDGKTYVMATGAGIVVRGAGGKARLLRGADLEGTYGEQRGCVVSNDGTHVACVRGGKGWVGQWPGT